jgi:uncharacterized protein (DUF779 family)
MTTTTAARQSTTRTRGFPVGNGTPAPRLTLVIATPAARALLRALQSADGPVVLVLSRRHSAAPLCFGAADYVPGPHDLLVARIEGAAVYLDRRDPHPDRLQLEVAGRPPHFVLKPAGSSQ